jgi:alcohol dehydrogenase, propanol-preferring
MPTTIPKTQLAATVPKQGGPVVFVEDYPVPEPGENEVLVKVLYTGVCQSGKQINRHHSFPCSRLSTDLHTARGTATGADGKPITNIKLPHVGGHEGVGRIVSFGPNTNPTDTVKIDTLVGIRFLSRVCHSCEYCTSDREQHCAKGRNHLHHEDGSFQQYCVLDLKYLTVLPEGMDEKVLGPVLCAGVTAYKVSWTGPV